MLGTVPTFFVYGEPDRPIDIGFLHVETVMERRQIHMGRVAAHKHDRMAQITFWTRGSGHYFIEDRKLDFIAPAVSFVPSGTVHGFTVEEEDSDAIVASIADSAMPPIRMLGGLPEDRAVMVRGQKDHPRWLHLSGTMQVLFDDYKAGLSLSLAALLAVAMNDIAILARAEPAAALDGNQGLAQAFRHLVDRHFREDWTIERYIETLGTTPHLLAKALNAAGSRNAKTIVDERRLLEAKRLLMFTVRSVEDVAYETGFRDPAYFSRFFRARTGSPPGRWRLERLSVSEENIQAR